MSNVKNKNLTKNNSYKPNSVSNNLNELKLKNIKLENELLLYKKENEKISKMRDYMFELLEQTQQKLADEEIRHKKDSFELKEEIKKILQENTKLKVQIKPLKLKAKRCDELEYNLNNTREKIKFDSYKLIEEAQCAMKDSIDVIETMISTANNFNKDIKKAKEDIKIGKHTLQDIILILEKNSNCSLNQLNKIKKDFYKNFKLE